MRKICGLMFIIIILSYCPLYAADVKISELPAVTTATTATDVLPIVASSVTSKITLANLIKAGLTFGSDAQYDILVRGASTYGRLASSANMISLLGSADYATARTNLGLGTMAVETATNYFPYSLADAAGDLFQGSADNTIAKLTKGAEGTLLRAGATLNAYTTATFADTYAKGTFLYNASANTVASLAHPGAANYFLITNAADTAAWTAGTNLTSINGLTFADASLVQLTGVGTSAVLTSGGNDYFLKSATDNSALMFATPAEVKIALGYYTNGDSPTFGTATTTKQIYAAPTELTLSSNTDGNITATQTLHTVDTFEDAASGALDTIAAGTDGQVLYLRAAHTDRTVVLDETDNIIIPYGSTLSLDSTSLLIKLVYDANLTKWVVVNGLPDTVNFSALDMSTGTSSIPWLVNSSTATNTAEGTAHWESDTDMLCIGDGATRVCLDFTANTILTLPSATGTLALTTHTRQDSATPVIGDADDFDDNFTGDNLYGGTFIVSVAGSILLANPVAGNNFTIVLEDAVATIIEPLATGTDDTIVLNGTALAQGLSIQSSTKGAMCVFQYRAADSWMATCNGFIATP